MSDQYTLGLNILYHRRRAMTIRITNEPPPLFSTVFHILSIIESFISNNVNFIAAPYHPFFDFFPILLTQNCQICVKSSPCVCTFIECCDIPILVK